MADYSSVINAYNNAAQQALASANKQREDALASANNLYNNQKVNYDKSWNTQKGVLDSNLATGKNETNQTAAAALREAAVGNQISQRNLGQRMAAMGRNGGAAESTLLSLANAYGRTREGHETTRQNALTSLQQAYNTDYASAQQGYWDNLNKALATKEGAVLNANNVWGALVQQIEQRRAEQEAQALAQQAQEAAAAQAAAQAAAARNTYSGYSSGGSSSAGSTFSQTNKLGSVAQTALAARIKPSQLKADPWRRR